MYYFFYINICKITNKYYFGVHKSKKVDDGYLASGMYKGKKGNRQGNSKIKNHIRKYGDECFIKNKIFFPDYNSCLAMEKNVVTSEKIKDRMCLNSRLGGEEPPNPTGFKQSQQHKDKHKEIYRLRGYKNLVKTKKRQLKSPEGIIYDIENLDNFCKENNLGLGVLGKVCKGKLRHYKGRTGTDSELNGYKDIPYADRSIASKKIRSFKKEGIVYTVKGLEDFYKENKLNGSRMRSLNRGDILQYKGREMAN